MPQIRIEIRIPRDGVHVHGINERLCNDIGGMRSPNINPQEKRFPLNGLLPEPFSCQMADKKGLVGFCRLFNIASIIILY
jgi:hypothetical protein